MVLLASAVLGIAALIAPWLALTIGWRVAAGTAGVLAAGATIAFLVGEIYPSRYGVRLDYLLPPLLLLAWSHCLVFLHEAKRKRSAHPGIFLSLILLADVLLLLLLMFFFLAPDSD